MITTRTRVGVAVGAVLAAVGVVLLVVRAVHISFDWFWGVCFLAVGAFVASAAMGLIRGQRNNA